MKKLLMFLLIFSVSCTGVNSNADNLNSISENSSTVSNNQVNTQEPTDTPTIAPILTETPSPIVVQLELSDGDFLEIPDSNTFRVLNYNINWDSIFPDDDIQNMSYREINREDEFARLINAIQPDIICLEEVNPRRNPQQVVDILVEITGDPAWVAISFRDNVIATHYSFIEGVDLEIPEYPPELPQAYALIDLPDELFGGQDVFTFCSHFKAAGGSADIKLRQRQADVLMNRVGDAISIGGAYDLPVNTPILMIGDFNIYDTDPAHHLVTLLTGDIFDEDRYGPDFHPDWDGTDFGDVYPSVNGEGENFDTWRDDGSPYSPGALDRIIFSDSVLIVENTFILDTTLLSDFAFDKYGLDFADVLFASELGNYDHLPMVVDFRFVEIP